MTHNFLDHTFKQNCKTGNTIGIVLLCDRKNINFICSDCCVSGFFYFMENKIEKKYS